MILKKATFYVAVAGLAATAVMASRMSAQPEATSLPIEPSPKPYETSVAASGIIEALSENVAIGVPGAGLVTRVHVKVWDAVREGQPLLTLDDRELQAQLAVNLANASVAEATLWRLVDQLARLKRVNDPRAVSQDEVRTKQNDVAGDLEVVLLTLTADVARNYYLLRSLDHEQVVIAATVALRRDAVNRALVAARDTAALANERYQQGLTSYLDVVDAQRAALQAERQDTQLRGQRAISTILLAKALGAGWKGAEAP